VAGANVSHIVKKRKKVPSLSHGKERKKTPTRRENIEIIPIGRNLGGEHGG